jgi:predicted DNA-binding protein (UPF0251 family)/predicted Fe-Mo cluster-binding NifX family protein
MSRPKKYCKVAFLPGTTYFKPAGVPLRSLEEICVSIEEIESVRLRDIENLDQEQCARYMNISRATYQRILESARKKIALGLLGGKAIKIEGGSYELDEPQCCCKIGYDQDASSGLSSRWSTESCSICRKFCRTGIVPVETAEAATDDGRTGLEHINSNDTEKRRNDGMKIAIVTDDEKTICQHFGRASLYVVFTVEEGRITHRETRPKMGHSHFGASADHHSEHGGKHGFDPASQQKHASMAEAIKDSQVLIAGGMGMGAYESMKSYKIEPIVTDVSSIEEAVQLYIEGKLPNLINRVH